MGGRNSIISGEAAKKIPDKFANLLKFLQFQPLISGEAPDSPDSPVPTPPGFKLFLCSNCSLHANLVKPFNEVINFFIRNLMQVKYVQR